MGRAGLQRLLDGLQASEHPAHVQDGVLSVVGAAAMGGAPARVDLDPLEPLVRGGQPQIRGLGDHRAVGGVLRDQRFRAGARVLFVGHRRHHKPAAREPAVTGNPCRRVDHRGHAALHVLAAAAVEAAVALDGIERRGHPFDAHRIRVPAEHQRASRRSPFDDPHDVGTPRSDIGRFDIDAGRSQLGRDQRRDGRLAGSAGDQRRIDRVDGYQVAQQADDGVHAPTLRHAGMNADNGVRPDAFRA